MRRLLLMLLAVATLQGSAGCVSYRERALSPGGIAEGLASRTLGDAGLRKFLASQNAGSGAWTADRLALAAVYFRGDLAVVRAQAEEAAARVKTAAQRPNPVLSFSPGYDTTSSGISPWLLVTALDIPIETAGKRGLRIAQARAEVEAARLRVAAAGWMARAEVRAAMLDLHAAQRVGALLEAKRLLHEDELKKLQIQVDAGESAAFQLTVARLALNQTRIARHDAEKLAATALARLAAAVGVPSAALAAVTLDSSPFETLPPDPGGDARRQALVHRADLLAALADYAAADAALRLEIARQYPNVTLNPGYELDQTDNRWSLGLTMELPVLNQNRGPIREADTRRKRLGYTFEAKQAAVFGEIEVALAAYRTTRAKAVTAAKLANEASHAADTVERLVKAGELAPLELTRRRIETSAATLALTEARMEAQQAAGALEAAVQLPTSSSP